MLDHISKRALITFSIAGAVLAAALAGGLVLVAGGPLYLAEELAGFVLFFELFYYALAATFAGFRASLRRRQETRELTMQEKIDDLAERLEAARERTRQRGQLIKSGICPRCGQAMTRAQKGRLVIARPCGHMLYEGRLK